MKPGERVEDAAEQGHGQLLLFLGGRTVGTLTSGGSVVLAAPFVEECQHLEIKIKYEIISWIYVVSLLNDFLFTLSFAYFLIV